MYKTCVCGGGGQDLQVEIQWPKKPGEINKTEHFINSKFACLINTKFQDYWKKHNRRNLSCSEKQLQFSKELRKYWRLNFYSESSNFVSGMEKSVRSVWNVNTVVPAKKWISSLPQQKERNLMKEPRTHLPLTSTTRLGGKQRQIRTTTAGSQLATFHNSTQWFSTPTHNVEWKYLT